MQVTLTLITCPQASTYLSTDVRLHFRLHLEYCFIHSLSLYYGEACQWLEGSLALKSADANARDSTSLCSPVEGGTKIGFFHSPVHFPQVKTDADDDDCYCKTYRHWLYMMTGTKSSLTLRGAVDNATRQSLFVAAPRLLVLTYFLPAPWILSFPTQLKMFPFSPFFCRHKRVPFCTLI